jgi:hypothetical protein
MKAPFPWFGGKSTVSNLVWSRLGNVPNYVEPFAGSLAVLLNRPHTAGIETVNDIDCYIANFWRALQSDPESLAYYADWPVNEADLQARHQWLVDQQAFRECVKADPDYYNVKIAGWWVWGIAQWIGSGWCDTRRQLPHLGDAGRGVNRKLPHLGDAGRGVNRQRQVLLDYFYALADRLRAVRVCCGDWSRVCGPTPTIKQGLTAVFVDPPYRAENMDQEMYGSNSDTSVAQAVRDWAVEHGNDPMMRIALCGYEDEHQMPDSWDCAAWKAPGGYGSQSNGQGRSNASRERIWFSPHCIKAPLFELLASSEVENAEATLSV